MHRAKVHVTRYVSRLFTVTFSTNVLTAALPTFFTMIVDPSACPEEGSASSRNCSAWRPASAWRGR